MHNRKDMFDFMLDRVTEVAAATGKREPQAFAEWFIRLDASEPQGILVPDGARDGKVDAFYTTTDGRRVLHHVLNSKFTRDYNKPAPAVFYEEMTYLLEAFENPASRPGYLRKVKEEFHQDYKKFFAAYDAGNADITFLTNCCRNDKYAVALERKGVRMIHLEDIVQFMIDDIDGAMPRTAPLLLTGIQQVLSPLPNETAVPTSIVFARVVDFLKYMEDDPLELLFARNVRLYLGSRGVNKLIKETFRDHPEEFVFSNNGVTLICEKIIPDPTTHELLIENPRVVNGSQTLHSVRDVESPSKTARVMVRIITIPRFSDGELSEKVRRRKDIINKVAIRSNQQNPIKPWNLVANDDFQVDIYRYFRKRNLFYERRENEWNYRSRHLKSNGTSRGPDLKWLMQLVASYNYDDKRLGPAIAKANTSSLFNGSAYDLLRQTSPATAYQAFLLGELVYQAYPDNIERYLYVKRFWNLCLFARLAKAIKSAAPKWSRAEITQAVEGWQSGSLEWRRAVRGLVEQTMAFYTKRARAYQKAEGHELTPLNYAKNANYIEPLLAAPVPTKVRTAVNKALNKGLMP